MAYRNYSFNSLMKHLRRNGVIIQGSTQKRQLMLHGYYHGYKGFRFVREPSNQLSISNYSQIQALIEYDESVKAILYTPIMRLETALKSIVSEIVARNAHSDSLSDIINNLMQSYLHKKGHTERKYRLRDDIYSTLTSQYSKSNIVKHYYSRDSYVPIWAIFEVISLGQFAHFVELLDPIIRLEISAMLSIPVNQNTNGKLLPKILFQLKDIRNAIAHNKPIFDGRYADRDTSKAIISWLSSGTGITNIDFDSLTDDIILIFSLMKTLRFKKLDLVKSVKDIIECDQVLFHSLPTESYMKIFGSDARKKLTSLLAFIRR